MTQDPSDASKTFVVQSLSSVTDGRPAARKWFDANGKDEALMTEIAVEAGKAYVTGNVSFSAANSFMNGLMVLAQWEAPKTFWVIYVALEDFELKENPGTEAVKHVENALASVEQLAPANESQARTPPSEA
jgi:hypothetical protein